jgi:hypothetical protein
VIKVEAGVGCMRLKQLQVVVTVLILHAVPLFTKEHGAVCPKERLVGVDNAGSVEVSSSHNTRAKVFQVGAI